MLCEYGDYIFKEKCWKRLLKRLKVLVATLFCTLQYEPHFLSPFICD
jgi:hypothetical protein